MPSNFESRNICFDLKGGEHKDLWGNRVKETETHVEVYDGLIFKGEVPKDQIVRCFPQWGNWQDVRA